MKNTIKFWGTHRWKLCAIALAAVIGFAMIACDADKANKKTDKGGKTWLGDGKLEFSNEQVYTDTEKYTGSDIKFSYKGTTGDITSGKLTLIADVPAVDNLETSEYFIERAILSYYWEDVKADNEDVKFFWFFQSSTFSLLSIDEKHDLLRMNSSYKVSDSGSFSGSEERVIYVYVDGDVKITGTGKSESSRTTKSFDLSLKKGWNAVTTKTSFSGSGGNQNQNISMSVNNPNVKWVLRSNP
jgi:hypothetical protein